MSMIIFFLLITAFSLSKKIKHKKTASFLLILSIIYTISIISGLLPRLLLSPLQSPFLYDSSPIPWGKNNLIILLGGGIVEIKQDKKRYLPQESAYARIVKASELYFDCRKEKRNCRILISGGNIEHSEKSEALVYEQIMMKLGIPLNDFILELNSRNTESNARYSTHLIQKNNFDHIVLVSSALHMTRALLWFHYFGLYPQAIPASYLNHPHFIRSISYNIITSDFCIHEYLGILQAYFIQKFYLNHDIRQ